jgi:hypothetical protein
VRGCRIRMLIASEHEHLFLECYYASRCHCRERKLRYVAVFWAALDKLYLSKTRLHKGAERKSARTRRAKYNQGFGGSVPVATISLSRKIRATNWVTQATIKQPRVSDLGGGRWDNLGGNPGD